ncbi:MAG: hypothetical protein OEZ06_04355 [Myxococcales bacterium]|nr:hypothetical protein [Myxococcales bacterium]
MLWNVPPNYFVELFPQKLSWLGHGTASLQVGSWHEGKQSAHSGWHALALCMGQRTLGVTPLPQSP